MKLTYLGTAAAEGFPALFCRCPFCLEAARLGGKNIRTRSQSLINDDLLIDLSPDTYHHFLKNGIEGDRIRYLLITHPHADHFYPQELFLRQAPHAYEMREETLRVVGSAAVIGALGKIPSCVLPTPIAAYETLTLGEYRVTALPAYHAPEEGAALIYVIEGEKTLLYAHDTAFLPDEVLEYIAKRKWIFDLISLDCTFVDSRPGSLRHMGLLDNERLLHRLEEMGAVTAATLRYVNHFSHNGNPLFDRLAGVAAEHGFLASYDGCAVKF